MLPPVPNQHATLVSLAAEEAQSTLYRSLAETGCRRLLSNWNLSIEFETEESAVA